GLHIGDAEKEEELHAGEGKENRAGDFAEKFAAQELAEPRTCAPLRAELFQVDDIVRGLERAVARHGVPPSCCALPARPLQRARCSPRFPIFCRSARYGVPADCAAEANSSRSATSGFGFASRKYNSPVGESR